MITACRTTGELLPRDRKYRVRFMNLDAVQLEGLADSLVDSHDKLMDELIAMRKKHRLTQETVAERMGVSQPSVAAFERYDANPTLSTIRRYALAVGANISHSVTDSCCGFEGDQFDAVIEGSGLKGWTSGARQKWDWPIKPVTIRVHVDQ